MRETRKWKRSKTQIETTLGLNTEHKACSVTLPLPSPDGNLFVLEVVSSPSNRPTQ